jgi:hypothetical protein
MLQPRALLAISALCVIGHPIAAQADAWYTTPGESWVSFGIAENRETEYGLPLFVCEAPHITLDAFTAQEQRSRRWQPPSGRTAVEIAGHGPTGSFSSGPLQVTFKYDDRRELWVVSGSIALTNPVWAQMRQADALELIIEGKTFSLTTAQLAEESKLFVTKCRKLLAGSQH